MILQQTSAYCFDCKISHPATVEVDGDQIVAVVQCPDGKKRHTISSNAELYLPLFRRFQKRKVSLFPTSRCILNYIPITDACNFRCKVCGANAKHGEQANYLDKKEIIRRLRDIERDKGILANFFGGEATLHPDIMEVVREGHALGLNVGIASNGYLIGTDREFTRKLSQNGLDRVCLQFDSLNRETLKKLGRDYLDVKLKAIEYCIEENIKFGLNSTVSRLNLNELPELMDFALGHIPRIFNMSLLSLAPIGRHEEEGKDLSVFREEMIEVVLKGWKKYGVSIDDFVLLPSYRPWGISIHPDCGASLLMAKNGKRIYPLNHVIDLEKLFTLMGRESRAEFSTAVKTRLAIHVFRSLRWRKTPALLRLTFSLLFRCKKTGFLNFGLTNYKTLYFQDNEKIKQCTCRFYTASGSIKGCHHFAMSDDFPGSAQHQQTHNLL